MPYLLCFSFDNIPAVFPFVKGFLHIFMRFLSEYSRFPKTGGRDKSLPPQTVGNPPGQRVDTHGGIVKGGGYAPLHVQSCKNGNFFGSFHFCLSSCRHFVDSLRGGRDKSLPPQTVGKPPGQRVDTHGGIVKGGGYAPLHVQSCKNGNFFGSFHFCLSSCRHFVDSLRREGLVPPAVSVSIPLYTII